MALANLATTDDLSAHKVDVSDEGLVAALLASASSAVREAAGCSITTTTGSVTLTPHGERWLGLPGYAITAVSAVAIDGTAVTDYTLANGALYRERGWGYTHKPAFVNVTYTQGLAECPADIVDLVVSLVAAGVARAEDGYNPQRGVSSERIDDYQRSFTRGEDEVVAPMELPVSTRQWLSERFGGGTYVTRERR